MKLSECDQIYRAAWETNNPSRFIELCLELLVTYRLLSVALARGNIFWRARVLDGGVYQNIRDLNYPPPEKATSGRLNRKGIPCFYISSNVETAVREVQAGPGELVQAAGFKVRPSKLLHLVLVGEYAHVHKRGYTSLNGTDPEGTIRGLLKQHSSQAEVMISIDKFFAAVLSDPQARETDYMRTQVLSSLLHERLADAHGIAFPSVRDPLGFNFGVLAKFSDEIFENTCCALQRVGQLHMYDMLVQDTVQSAISTKPNGDFVWSPNYEPGQWYQYALSDEEMEAGRKAGKVAEGTVKI